MGAKWKKWLENRVEELDGMRLKDQKHWTKADVQALAGLSYSRQSEFAEKAGVKMKMITVYGKDREVYSVAGVVKLLKELGWEEHTLDGEAVIVNLNRVIKL